MLGLRRLIGLRRDELGRGEALPLRGEERVLRGEVRGAGEGERVFWAGGSSAIAGEGAAGVHCPWGMKTMMETSARAALWVRQTGKTRVSGR